ncbi:MAG: histidinol phosphate phosphatase [Spirochaetae bacterium HGW-Spirochaetae-1]|jgi:histidinol-phosphatase (PHP family)|nr:MAG: histidinol phosphate phosphatase [Spirochaetae bacterium HGW-Spirochaetae-1]
MKLVNLHNHTSLCGHARGTMDEYIISAREKGIAVMGFSDHAPLPSHLRNGITMEPEQTEEYIALVENKKIEFDGSMEILLGFEVDFPLHDSFPQKYFTDARIDYLIGSCHFIDDWPFDHDDYVHEFDSRDINDVYTRYFEIIGDLVGSRLFDMVGHFDLVKKFGHRATKDFSATIDRIAGMMSSLDIAAEINTSGLIKPVKEMYPSDDILKIFFDNNVPITLGSDSHSPEHVGYMFDAALEKIKKAGYTSLSFFRKRKRYTTPL